MSKEIESEKREMKLTDILSSKNTYDAIDNGIKYIKENIGFFTFAFTLMVTLGSLLLRILTFLVEYGYASYYHIPPQLIHQSNFSILYDILIKGIFASLLIALNMIPYLIWKSKYHLFIRSFFLLLILLIVPVLCILAQFFYSHFDPSVKDLINIFKSGCILSILLWLIGYLYILYAFILAKIEKKKTYRHSPKKKTLSHNVTVKSSKKILIVIIIVFALESFLCIFFGYLQAGNTNQFKILEGYSEQNYYAVIYETDDSYIITNCEINENEKTISFVNLDTKKEVAKDGIECIIRKLRQK